MAVYQWDTVAARFRDPLTGRYVGRDKVRGVLDDLVLRSQARITTASDALRTGNSTVAEWQATMREEIKRTHLQSEALLRGGWKQMTPADYGRVGARVKEQYRYLDNFTKELEQGKQITDGGFMARARMYAASARVGFHDELGKMLLGIGYTEERNVLHPAEHCAECVDMSALGWVPIGTVVPIGSRQCLGNDKCSMKYR